MWTIPYVCVSSASTYCETLRTRDPRSLRPPYPSRAQEGHFSRDGKVTPGAGVTRRGIFFWDRARARPARARVKPSGETRQLVHGGGWSSFPGGIQVTKSCTSEGVSHGVRDTGTRLWPVSSGLISRQDNPANLISTSPTSLRRPNSPLTLRERSKDSAPLPTSLC